MKMEFLQTISGAGFFYPKGLIVEVEDSQANKFIGYGWARNLNDNPIVLQTISQLTSATDGIPIAPEDLNSLSEVAEQINLLKLLKANKVEIPDISAKADKTELDAHKTNTLNPHLTTKEQVGVNFQSGTIAMTNSKKAIIIFSVPFNKVPRVTLTLLDNSQAPSYSTGVSKTGFIINMPTPFTGSIEFIALERE